jgi:hypothetical protein
MKPTLVTDSLPLPANGTALRQRELGISEFPGRADFALTFRDRLDNISDVVETEIN